MSCALTVILSLDAPHAAFEHIPHAEFPPDLLHVDRLALVGESGIAGDDEAVEQMRQIGRQIIGDAVGEIVLLLVAAQVLERQHDDREPRRSWQAYRQEAAMKRGA